MTCIRAATLFASALVLSAFAGGCSKFAGEWVEEGRFTKDGVFEQSDSNRLAALKFEPPFIVKYGGYVTGAEVVDAGTVQTDTYFEMSNGTVAQFGSIIAKVEDKDHLIAYIASEPKRRFVRVKKGPSVFPPAVTLTSYVKADASPAAAVAPQPVMASTEKRPDYDQK